MRKHYRAITARVPLSILLAAIAALLAVATFLTARYPEIAGTLAGGGLCACALYWLNRGIDSQMTGGRHDDDQ